MIRVGSWTRFANDVSRIYQVKHTVFGCSRRTGRRTELYDSVRDPDAEDFLISKLRLAGNWVVYATNQCAAQMCSDGVDLTDLRTGRGCVYDLTGAVTALELTTGGKAVWIDTTRYGNGGPNYPYVDIRRVAVGSYPCRSAAPGGLPTPTILESGIDIDLKTLAVTRDRAFWLKAGVPQSGQF